MNLATKLKQRAAEDRPVRIGLIGLTLRGGMPAAGRRAVPGLRPG